MIIGIGIDIIELSRVQEIINNQPRFVDRILTPAEKEVYVTLTNHRKVEFLAGRFSAKEAFSKAIGTGIGKEVSFQDISILSDELGKPVMKCVGEHRFIHVSISHSQHYAVSQVIIEER